VPSDLNIYGQLHVHFLAWRMWAHRGADRVGIPQAAEGSAWACSAMRFTLGAADL